MPKLRLTTFLRNIAILFLGVLASAWLLDGIHAESTTTLLLVALVLALLNLVVKPLLVLFTLPFVVLTFGLGLLLINAVLLYTAGHIVPGFVVTSFGTAFLGALIISLTSMAVSLLLPPRPNIRVQWSVKGARPSGRSRRSIRDDDAIDV